MSSIWSFNVERVGFVHLLASEVSMCSGSPVSDASCRHLTSMIVRCWHARWSAKNVCVYSIGFSKVKRENIEQDVNRVNMLT